ncbi:J domain-containing protein [Thermaurantiacus sp.]
MRRRERGNDWGFPRWRPYGGQGNAPETLRRCDHFGCDQPGTCPAPKAPNRPERWWFCQRHAAEYNRAWNYFAALDAASAEAQEQTEERESGRYRTAAHWAWGEGDGSRSRAELEALRALDLDADADEHAVRVAFRQLAKANHPDLNPGDADAAERFRLIHAAYRVLTDAADARASGQGPSRPRK